MIIGCTYNDHQVIQVQYNLSEEECLQQSYLLNSYVFIDYDTFPVRKEIFYGASEYGNEGITTRNVTKAFDKGAYVCIPSGVKLDK